MNIYDIFKPFVNFKKFEETKQTQHHVSGQFLQLVKSIQDNEIKPVRMEFFFEAKSHHNANCLKNDLERINYEVFKIWKSSDDRYWITGRSDELNLDDEQFHLWIDLMNEVGFINDCQFDGWGILMAPEN